MNSQAPAFDLVIGMDRSDRKVDLHLLDRSASTEESATLATDPAALQAWATDLRQRYPQHRVAIVFEQPANNLIGFLSRYDWITLYPINPISLQKFRETFVVSRAKDDAKDAAFLARLLATDRPGVDFDQNLCDQRPRGAKPGSPAARRGIGEDANAGQSALVAEAGALIRGRRGGELPSGVCHSASGPRARPG